MMLKRFIFFPLALILVFAACTSTQKKTGDITGIGGRDAPQWVYSAELVYPAAQYVAATGFAETRSAAEASAYAALTTFFGQTILVDNTSSSSYRQAISSGTTDSWINSAEINTYLKQTALMDNMLGAEIKDVWFDSRGIHYAVAVMEKERSARLYNELIQANLKIIENLVALPGGEKNTFDGVIRHKFAAVVADMNIPYRNIVRLLDKEPPDGILDGDFYRLEAQNIIRAIPVSIRVSNDKSGRIFGAFAKCFSDQGFETNTGNSRYVLNVDTEFSQPDLPNNPNKFARIELSANLTDTVLGLVLLPYNFNLREGHVTLSEAENRTVAASEKKINQEFAGLLSEYLSKLMPKT